MKEADALKFQKKLNEEPFVKETSYISKEQALKEQSEAMGTDPAEFLGYNPFTASIEIKLNADYANSDSISWIEQKIMQNKEKLWKSTILRIYWMQHEQQYRKISFLLLGLAALLTLISFALINNTIRLAIYSKRFLIHTMKLVGASWGFIRRPFLVRNIWIGILAAAMADAALIGMAYALVRYEPELIEIITPMTMLMVMVLFLCLVWLLPLCVHIYQSTNTCA